MPEFLTASALAAAAVFIAEFGDKSQLLTLAFATRYPALPVIAGLVLGATVIVGLSVLVGAAVGAVLPAGLVALVAGVALYAGEGSKTDGAVAFANSDPRMILFFVTWLRRFFAPDEARLRMRLYLHQGLDLDAAVDFWSTLTGIPPHQFGKPYRAVPDPSIRRSKHPLGCPSVGYSCSRTHRSIMGLVGALLSSTCFPG